MSAREDFGEPTGSDLLLEMGLVYFRRSLVVEGVRAFLSGVPLDVAEASLQTALIEIRNHGDDA